MKPIRWRKVRGSSLGRFAKVDGLDLVLYRNPRPTIIADDAVRGITLRDDANPQQIDAAAYALADLVATLKGLE